jgi:hypothetical protein
VPTVINRAVGHLRAIEGVVFDASEDAIVVPAASDEGFVVRLRMVSGRNFVVEYDGWRHTFDRAEDAYDCFEYGLSESCRLKTTLRGDVAVSWQVEKREFGMWVPGHATRNWRGLGFWRPARVVYYQNHVFRIDP